MAVLVLDASVALAALLPQEADEELAIAILRRVEREGAVAPRLWPTEVLNGLLMAARRKRITPAQVAPALFLLAALKVRIADEEDVFAAWDRPLQLAITHRLTAYDAAYLALAQANGLPLATFDRELRRAADAEGVPSLP